ncbi:hypothetical protein JCM8547_000081 [Rhodosporidiobolus lusitaniae]
MLALARRAQYAQKHPRHLLPQISHLRVASTLTTPLTPPPLTPAPTPDLIAALATEEPESKKSAYLWYNQIFPIRVGVWDVRYLLSRLQQTDLLETVRDLVPKDAAYQVKVESVEPRAKDGGAFVRFSFKVPEKVWESVDGVGAEGEVDEALRQKRLREVEAKIAKLIEKEAAEALNKSGWKPWFALGRPSRAFLVKGRPWMEDLNRFPSREIRVEYEGPEIPQEELYEVFRPYGRIHDIVPGPKSARVIYTSTRSATSARNCLHAAKVPVSSVREPDAPPSPTTILRILYAEKQRENFIKDWITSHPRITIPILVALLGGLGTYAFDPIREWFVKNKVQGTFDAEQWVVVRWLKKETLGRLGLTGRTALTLEQATGTGIEKERQEAKEQLETWLRDVPDTFIVVTGPQGSGKTALVNEVLADGKSVVPFSFKSLLSILTLSLVSELAASVGYWPQFVLASSLNNMIDLAAMGLIGQKAGFSSSLDTQLKAILEVTATALSSIANSTRARAAAALTKSASRKDAQHERDVVVDQLKTDGIRDGRIDAVAGNGVVAELGGGIERPAAGLDKVGEKEKKLEIVGPKSSAFVKEVSQSAAREEKEGDAPVASVERLPVVVIKNFSGKGEAKQELLYECLSEWAAVLIENQAAHVVFLSDASTVTKPLAKVLPSRPLNTVTLTDANPEASLQYVSAKLSSFEQTLPLTAAPAIARLGGRQTDLELLVSKIRAGQTVDEAIDDIVQRETVSLRKALFGDDEEEAKGLKWSRDQAAALVKGLSEKGELKYAETLLTTFGGDDSPLRALEASSLIAIHHVNGRPSSIRPGKPVYRSACERLLADVPFSASLQYRTVSAGLSSAAADIQSAQKELQELAQLFTSEKGRWAFGGGSTVPKEVEVRVGQLLQKMRGAQEKSEKLGKEKARLLKVLRQAE